jgi:hypothetical protein
MNPVPDDWTSRLAQAVATAIRDFHRSYLKDSPVVVFDLGCFPWHGRIELSFLTAADLDADAGLFDRSEIASWPHYEFVGVTEPWPVGKELGQQMAALYHDTDDVEDDIRDMVVETFLQASAGAVATPEVTAALNELTRDPRFQIRVQHPDTGQEFWPPIQIE